MPRRKRTRKNVTAADSARPKARRGSRNIVTNSPSLTIHLEESFIPNQLQDRQPGTVAEYRKAVRRFVVWSGLEIRLHDIDEFLIERWRRAMILDGLAFRTACQWATFVRRIVRHGCPGHCLKGIGRRPHEDKPTVIRGMDESAMLAPERSLLKFALEVYVPRRMVGCRELSINQIRWSLNRFAKFLGRPPLLDDCSNESMSKFMNWMVSVRNLRPATVNGTRKNIVSLWNYLNKRGILKERPIDCDKVREPRNLPKAWTVEELGRIIAAARQQTSPKTGMVYPAPFFFPALLMAAYDTGLRVRALLSVRRADWNSARRELTATAEFAKTAVAQTFVVSGQTADAIHQMISATHLELRTEEIPEFLFHWPIRQDGIHEHFRAILKRAGLHEPGTDTWHRLRKTCATHLTAAIGIEAASRQLGHSGVQMTRRYVDPRLTGHHNAAEHLPRPQIR